MCNKLSIRNANSSVQRNCSKYENKLWRSAGKIQYTGHYRIYLLRDIHHQAPIKRRCPSFKRHLAIAWRLFHQLMYVIDINKCIMLYFFVFIPIYVVHKGQNIWLHRQKPECYYYRPIMIFKGGDWICLLPTAITHYRPGRYTIKG